MTLTFSRVNTFIGNGMAYNSYIVLDNKIAVSDTVDRRFAVDRWFDNLADALGDKKPDYLIVQHLGPDHSFGIQKFIEKYPDTRSLLLGKRTQNVASVLRC